MDRPEPADQRPAQRRQLLAAIAPAPGRRAPAGRWCRPTNALTIARPLTPITSVSALVNFTPASSRTFCRRLTSRLRSRVCCTRYRVMSRSSRIGGGGTKLLRSRPHSSSCASHSLSLTSVFRPGTRFKLEHVDQQQRERIFQHVIDRLPVDARALERHVRRPIRLQPLAQARSGPGSSSRTSRSPPDARRPRPAPARWPPPTPCGHPIPRPRVIMTSMRRPPRGSRSVASATLLGVLGGNNTGCLTLQRQTPSADLAVPVSGRRHRTAPPTIPPFHAHGVSAARGDSCKSSLAFEPPRVPLKAGGR